MVMHVQIEGPESGIPVVLCNGMFAALESWDTAMPYLEGCRVLRFDGKGQGRSPKPEEIYHMDGLVQDLAEIVERVGLQSAYLVGISQGGTLALAFAAAFPDKVAGVVAADCHVQVSPLLRLKLESWLKANEVGGPTLRFDIAAPWIWSQELLNLQPELISYYRERAAFHPDHAVRGLIEGALNVDLDVSRITCPVLALTGEQDLLTPPWEMWSFVERLADGRQRLVPGAHASLLEHPHLFGSLIVPVLKEWADVG